MNNDQSKPYDPQAWHGYDQEVEDAWQTIEEEMRKKNKRQIIAFCLVVAAVSLILLLH